MQTKAIDRLKNIDNADLARLNLALNVVSEQMHNEGIAFARFAFEIKAYDPFRNVDWDSLNRLFKRLDTETTSIPLSIPRIREPEPNKNSADARFATRFGSPLRIRLQKMKLNRYEQQERRGKIFTAYRAILNSILERQATEGEIFGYEKIVETEKFSSKRDLVQEVPSARI